MLDGGGAAVTVSDTIVPWVALAAVPVTVIGYVPGAVVLAVARVNAELAPAVTDDGLNVAVAPVGSPLALSATLCAEPLVTAVEIVDVPLLPAVTVTALG